MCNQAGLGVKSLDVPDKVKNKRYHFGLQMKSNIYVIVLIHRSC